MPLQKPATAYRGSVFKTQSEEVSFVETPFETTTTLIPEVTTTTSTTIVIVVTTVTTAKPKPLVDGPPHNTTTLVGCISYWESSWGKDPNVFQFIQSTWEHYGGVGSPSRALYSVQEAIFWLAWNDDGPHHWAAQKGRCF